ncbi:MAG: MOSC domain-containing protein [Solirubrobacterales bacterium]|nr:MOSC domain-containing protein [Solirubrobacterales bacterium]
MPASVTGLSTAPVKGMRVSAVESIELDERGARGDRAFFIIDADGRLVNGKRLGDLQAIVPEFQPAANVLALRFPGGESASAALRYGNMLVTRFHSRALPAREVHGPWSDALSTFAGRPLRLVASETAIDRGPGGTVSIISRGSLRRLAEAAQTDAVDARRFRMLIEIDGVAAHGEDDWVGRRIAIGPSLVAVNGHVGRCVVTTRDPDTGIVGFPTLRLLATYRREVDSTEPLAFGIYGGVLQGGTVRLGDRVALAG